MNNENVIIDVYAHLGEDVVFDETLNESQLIDAYERNGVFGRIVQPYLPRPYIEDHRKIHDRIYELTKSTKKRFWDMASINLMTAFLSWAMQLWRESPQNAKTPL